MKPEYCQHCQQPLDPKYTIGEGFCCQGCETVYRLLHSEGLDRFYDLNTAQSPPVSVEQSSDFTWMQDQKHTGRLDVSIQGIHCAACVWLLEEVFERQDGSSEVLINPTMGEMSIVYDPQLFDPEGYFKQVEQMGYRAVPRKTQLPRESQHLLWRLGISTALTMNVMLMYISFYMGLSPSDDLFSVFWWVSLGLTLINVGVGGWPFISTALRVLRKGLLHLDLPIAVGIVASLVSNLYMVVITKDPEMYLDSLNAFITLMLAGRFFQTRSIERNRQQLQQDQDEMDWVMTRLTEDGQEPVSVQHVESGDQLLIPMGGVIPVDAVLMSPNQVRLSLAWITGESESVEFTVGTEISSGAINSSGHPIEVVATQEWTESELKQLLTLPPGRESEDVPEWFRPILKWYVPIVFALAGLGVALWWSTGVKPSLQVMTALLIVTCPCAFGIALPLAKEIAVLKLRTIGVFIRSERFFARAHQIKRVVFDKTGTITLGRLTVHTTDDLSPVDLQVLYNMVSRSSHPKSQALMTWATRQLDTPERRVDFPLTEDPGIGLFHADYRLIGDADLDTVLVRGDNQIASFQFSEGLRGDMLGIFDALKHAGVEVSVLSGDRPERVQQAMSQIGVSDIEAIGGLSPQDKSDWILSHHPAEILMVGDGLNDAKAFDVAALSVTPANNLAGLLSRADVYVTGDNLRCIGQALQSVQHTTRVQQQVFLGALVYNVIAIGFSFMGWMTPLWAAILMPISSISLVSFTLFAQQSMLEEK